MRTLAIVQIALAILLAVPAAADGPAVSDTNLKVSGFGGATSVGTSDDGLGGLAGSLTLPMGQSFGLQIDGGYASLGGADFVGGGAHLFWRDPLVGLLGVYAGYAERFDTVDTDIGRIGAEAQYFLSYLLTIDHVSGGLVALDDNDCAKEVGGITGAVALAGKLEIVQQLCGLLRGPSVRSLVGRYSK